MAVSVGSIGLVVVARRWAQRRRLDGYDYVDRNIAIANVGWAVALVVIGVRLLTG